MSNPIGSRGFVAGFRGMALAFAILGVSGLPSAAQGYGAHGSMMGGAGSNGMKQGYSGDSGNGNAADGKDLYLRDCASCHRPDGSGGMKFGNVTAPDLRAPGLDAAYHNDDRLLARAILRGIDPAGNPLDRVMPRWQGQFTTDQTAALIGYLKRLHK
jgi:mono/diheme cytochrome c family protein